MSAPVTPAAASKAAPERGPLSWLDSADTRPVLVVDLDGTLLRTDTLFESALRLLKQSPLNLLRLIAWLARGRAGLKRALALRVVLDAACLPYSATFLAYLVAQRASGRRMVLATAADASIAHAVAGHLGLFDAVLASDGSNNLKGRHKLHAIVALVGENFVYAGDCSADLPVWQGARGALLVNVPAPLAASVTARMPVEMAFPRVRAGAATWLRAFRVHQWAKNCLMFVPMLTAFSMLDGEKALTLLAAFLAFSLAASATYVVNDLWDLDSDRVHPRKRARPFASGDIPIGQGVLAALAAMAAGLLLGAWIGPAYLAVLLLYVAITSTYSMALKEYVLVDVIVLSVLYTLRIIAGAIAIAVTVSHWLLAFSVFIFFSLALVKRCSELVSLQALGGAQVRGRDYRVGDLTVLWPLGVGASMASVVVFGLFISAPETQARYASPSLLWAAGILMIYWTARLWIKTARGEMHDDPVVYAIRDRGSRLTVLAMIAVVLVGRMVALPGM